MLFLTCIWLIWWASNIYAKNGVNNRNVTLSEKYKWKQLDRIEKSIKWKKEYRFLIETTDTKDKITNYFKTWDKKSKVKKLWNNKYMVKLPLTSTFLKDELTQINNWILPLNIWWYNVVQPEIMEGFNIPIPNLNPFPLIKGQGATLWTLPLLIQGNSTWSGEKVWVLDTWIDYNHTDLSSKYDSLLSYDFVNDDIDAMDDNGHGTQVSWLITNSNLVWLKVLDANGLGTSYDVLEAIDYAKTNNIKIINISFGWFWDPATSPVCQAITDAKNAWIYTVVSAWNTNQDVSNIIPAWCNDAIVVWATDIVTSPQPSPSQGEGVAQKASFSNYGSWVLVYTPWVNINTTNLNNTYITKSGTSFSAPKVTSIISQVLANNPNITSSQVISDIKNNYWFITNFSIDSTTNTNTSSWTSASWTTLSWAISAPQIDYNSMKYYSGYFIHDWNKYWNSLYDTGYTFTAEELKNVQVYTYAEYQNILKNTKADFSAMSIPTSGLVWKWDLNGNANDSSWNGNSWTPVNVTWTSWLWWNTVANFNGTNSYIYNNSPTWLSKTNWQEITANTWIKWNWWGWYQDIMTIRWSAWHNWILYKHVDWSKLGFHGLTNQYRWTYTIPVWEWIMVTASVNSSWTLKIYVNWQLKDTFSWYTYWANYSNNFTIWSAWNSIYSEYFNWSISNALIYNRALSISEIQQLYYEWQVCNTTSTNLPTYQYNPVTNNSAIKYNYYDTNSLMCVDNTNKISIPRDATIWDPVNLATWEFDYDNTLMSIPWNKIPYEFKLNYKNQVYYNWPAWINWDHNYNMYLSEETNWNVLYYNGKLWVFRFIKNTTTFDYNPWLKATLTQSWWLYTLNYDSGDKNYFNTDKKLSKLEDINGNNLNFAYSWWLLSQVTDTLWRNINYNYYDHNRLKDVTDFNGRKVELNYFTWSTNSWSIYDLKEIKINNGTWAIKTINFEYTVNGDDNTNHNITKLVDSKWQTYVTNTYLNDRVATQKYGTWTIAYNYTLSWNTITKNTVTDRLWNIVDYFYDSNWNNTQSKHYTSSWTIDYYYTYNSLWYLESEKRPKWNGYKYSYDSKWNLTEKRFKPDLTQADSTNDLITTYTYNTKNQILTQTNPNNTTITNTYDINGNLTQITTSWLKRSDDTTYQTTNTFTYNTIWQLITSTDANTNTTNYTYTNGNLTQITSWTWTSARTQTIWYNTYWIPTSKTDAKWNIINFNITNYNQVGTGTTAEGIVTKYEYDENNNKTKETNYLTWWTTKITTYEYDLLDNPTKVVSEYDTNNQLITTIKYDNNSNIIEKQSWSWATTKYYYNEFSKLKQEKIITNPNDTTKDVITNYEYDNNGNIIKKTDSKWNITTYEYNNYDQLIKETKTDWSYTLLNYNTSNLVSQKQNFTNQNTLLSKTIYVYNWQAKIIKEVKYLDPVNNSGALLNTLDYDNNGNVTSKIDAKWNQTTFTYDAYNNQTQILDAKGNKVVNTYDKNNNLTKKEIIQSNNKTTTTNYSYDTDNRLISETNNNNKTKTYIYNNLNQIITTTDEKGNETNYTYDYNNKIKTKTQVINSQNITTTYTYDERWNNTSITDQNWNTTNYEYDNLNRLTKTKYADNKELNYTYDKNNNLLTQTDPNGTIVTNSFDNLNRLSNITIQTGTGILWVTIETYSYDELGRLTWANDSNNHGLSFAYDSINRLTQENQSGSLVNYTYDDNNNITSITNSNNKTTSYSYDELNRNTQVSFSWETIATYSFTWILNDSITYGNNKTITQTYDDLLRLTSLNNWVKTYNYTYDDVNNITSDSVKNYSYDDVYRVVWVNNTNSWTLLESFSYDNAGNRITDKNNEYNTNVLNQYTTLSWATLSWSLVYDNNGNLTQNSKYKFSYDYKNRLVKVTNISWTWIIVEFKYDVLWRRYEKKVNNETVNYIYSDKNILSEYKTINWNTFKKEYINWLWIDNVIAFDSEENWLSSVEKEELNFCENTVLSQTWSFTKYWWNDIVNRCNSLNSSWSLIWTNRYYLHKNHLGSVVAITNNSWSVVTEYDYDVFWKTTIINWTDIWNTILFTGREYDKEIGLYYFRARYYDAELGRFINRDPIGQVDDVNLYGYVGNNSVMFVDPFWLWKYSIPSVYDNMFILDDVAIIVLHVLKVWIESDPLYQISEEKLQNWVKNYKDAHYLRNYKLRKFKDFLEVENAWYIRQDNSLNKFHRYVKWNISNTFNVKYLSIDKQQEVIYNENTKIFDYSNLNWATYNYWTDTVSHIINDVIPYYILWNSPNDPTTRFERIMQTFK